MRPRPGGAEVMGDDVRKLVAKNLVEARKIASQGGRKRNRSSFEVGSGPALRQACREPRRDRLAQVWARPEVRVPRDRFNQSAAHLHVGMLPDSRTRE